MIDHSTIDRIMDAAQIYDVVSDFVTLRKRGVNYVGLCPFHDDKTPSFYVSPAKNLCKCFACGKGGNPVHFIMLHEQLSYPDALRFLAKKYHIEIQEREQTAEEKAAQTERDSLFVVNQFACDYFRHTLRDTDEGRNIGMAYLRSRGFRDDIIEKFQLGYCTESHDAFAKEALAKGYQKDFLVKTGLCYETDDHRLRDRFWGRVIFPVHTLSGKVVAFGGRVLAAATKGVKVKYVNSPESEIYHKSNELYGIYQAKQAIVKQDRCFLVEGYTDVISMHQSGVENVVASSGTALTTHQIKLIHRFTNNLTVLYDGDAAGIKASLRGIDMLLEEGMNIKVCLLPDGDDPDSFARKHNSTEFQAFIREHETDFIRFKTNLLLEDAGRDPIKRAELIGSLVQSIAVIPESAPNCCTSRTSCWSAKWPNAARSRPSNVPNSASANAARHRHVPPARVEKPRPTTPRLLLPKKMSLLPPRSLPMTTPPSSPRKTRKAASSTVTNGSSSKWWCATASASCATCPMTKAMKCPSLSPNTSSKTCNKTSWPSTTPCTAGCCRRPPSASTPKASAPSTTSSTTPTPPSASSAPSW